MSKPKTYTLPELFSSTLLGFTFEFYSSKAVNFIIEELSKITIKNIILTNFDSYNPSYGDAILFKEYEGSKPKYSLKLSQQRYDSIMPIVKEVLKWISNTSECKNDTLLRVNLSFDHNHLKTINSISNMNTQKLLLKIDEDYIYERFPEQKNSAYCMSVNNVTPLSEISYTSDLVKNINYIIGIPTKNYYGINLSDYSRGIIEFNYIGGIDYSEKEKEILEVIQYYIIKTYQSLNEADMSNEEYNKLRKLTDNYYKIQEIYYDSNKFNEIFPEINLFVDLRKDSQIIKSYWTKIRNMLFEAIINNNFKKGDFNYDTQYSSFQIRNAELKCTNLKNFDIVKCDISGVTEKCNFVSCEITNARIYQSVIVNNSEVKDSYLKNVLIEHKNIIDNCFIDNNYELINCTVKNSIIKFASLGQTVNIDDNSIIIDRQDKIEQNNSGIEIEEIRDYKWIKNLTGKKSEQHTMGNEFIQKRRNY